MGFFVLSALGCRYLAAIVACMSVLVSAAIFVGRPWFAGVGASVLRPLNQVTDNLMSGSERNEGKAPQVAL